MTTVLVLTNSFDDCHVEAVFDKIHLSHHRTLRVDIDRIVRGEHHISLNYNNGTIIYSTPKGSFDLMDAESVWFRKPFGFGPTYGFVEHIKDPVQRDVVDKEMHDLVNGICALLADKFWINHPSAINRARLKPHQLRTAQKVGLSTIETIITSNPSDARKFCKQGSTVFKPLTVSSLKYGEVYYIVETTLMTDELIDSLDLIQSQPIILQRYIDKACELRITCVGDELFVARQTPTDSAANIVDWRSLQDDGSRYDTNFVLPSSVAEGIHQLMLIYDLGFAAMDFVVDKQENVYFLEVNPNGQWLGYTDEIGLPAATSIANCLVDMTRHLPIKRR